MAAIVKEADYTAGVEGYNPTTVAPGTSTGTQAQVFIGNMGVVCKGDAFITHYLPPPLVGFHTPYAGGSGGSNVFVGPQRKEVFINSQPMSPGCGDLMSPIPGTVNAGI